MSEVLERLKSDIDSLELSKPIQLSGRVSRFDGHIIECDGFPATIGTICQVDTQNGETTNAEVIGFQNNHNLLSVHDHNARISVGATVMITDDGHSIQVGSELLGRAIDALGDPLDNGPPMRLGDTWPLNGKKTNPLARRPVNKQLDVGVRVINSLLSVGRGQRVGIIAGSGVGKSVLLGMMTRYTEADIVVVGLIGERAREVASFTAEALHGGSRERTVIVAEPADRSPLLRIRGANRATAIAEYFRAKGKNVLLIMDSLTRVAHARREIGLALGEQPTSKGYPPSVVSMIPALIERTGTGIGSEGSITGFYTVLADGDDANDPVVDTARAILDGHILLSREQAQMGIYPAIDLSASVSRVMNDIAGQNQIQAAQYFRRLISLYMENRDLILMGGYAPGQDQDLDLAVQLWPQLMAHIQQPFDQSAAYDESIQALTSLFNIQEQA